MCVIVLGVSWKGQQANRDGLTQGIGDLGAGILGPIFTALGTGILGPTFPTLSTKVWRKGSKNGNFGCLWRGIVSPLHTSTLN